MKLSSSFLDVSITLVCAIVTYVTVGGWIGLLLAIFLSYLVLIFQDMLTHGYINRNVYRCRGFMGQFEKLKLFFLILICAVSLASFYLVSPIQGQLYADPKNIPLANWLRHASAILLTTFVPGYMILNAVDYNQAIKGINKLLLSYILGVFSTFLVGYIIILSGNSISELGIFGISTFNVAILLTYTVFSIKRRLSYRGSHEVEDPDSARMLDMGTLYSVAFWIVIIGLVMVLTYGQYGTQIVSDQQNHHGHAMLLSRLQLPKDALAFPQYPWLFHTYLAIMFVTSGIPSINVYNSLNFLNIMPVLAFYAMVKSLFRNQAHASSIAASSTFFAFFTSGFGWTYVLGETLTGNVKLFSETIYLAWVKTYDILTPNSFIVAGHPDVTTPLLLIGLPSMFVLFQLSLADQMDNSGRLKYFLIIITMIFGYLGHVETIVIIGTLMIVSSIRKDGLKTLSSLLIALVAIHMIDISSPSRYYSTQAVSILGCHFTFGTLLLLTSVGAVSVSLVFHRMKDANFLSGLGSITKRMVRSVRARSGILLLIFSSAMIYLYLLAFVIWGVVRPDFSVHFVFGYDGSVPWYFYPMRLGVVGLIALVGSLYWLSTRKVSHIRQLFPFYVWSFVTVIVCPYYPEYRLTRHLYLPLSVIASFALCACASKISTSQTIVELKRIGERPTQHICRISSVRIRGEHMVTLLLLTMIMTSIGSPLLCIRAVKDYDYEGVIGVLPRRQPFTEDELEALNWLRLNIDPMTDAVLSIPRGLGNEVVDIGGAWAVRTNQYTPFFEVGSPENLFDLCNKIQPKYLYLNWKDRDILKSSTEYAHSFTKQLIDYLPIAFNNSKVTIYEVPKFAPSSRSSSIAFVASSTSLPITTVSLANLNYSIIDKDDPNKYNYGVLILPDHPGPEELKEYSKWVEEGGHLVIFDFPPDPSLERSYGAQNGTFYGLNPISGGWSIIDDEIIESTSGDILSEETIEGDYVAWTYAKVVETLDPDNHLGLLFNYQDTDNYYHVFLREKQLVLCKRYDGTERECYWANVERSNGTFQKLAVRVEPPFFRFYVDDTFVGEYLDQWFIEGGRVGLCVHRLVGHLSGINVKMDPTKYISVDGIIGKNTLVDIPEIEVPLINETLPFSETASLNAHYMRNGEKISPFAFTVRAGNGNITYINFPPLFMVLEKNLDQRERRLLFSKLGEIFSSTGLNLPYQQAAVIREVVPINFVRGAINSSGRVILKTNSFWLVEQKALYGTIDLSNTTRLEIIEGNGEALSGRHLFNATILEYTVGGPVETIIQTSRFNVVPSDSGVYALIEIPDTFTWTNYLSNYTRANLVLLMDDFVTRISVLGGSMTINVLNASQISNHKRSLKIYARYPEVQLNGQTFIDHAYLSESPTSVIAYGIPIVISGTISFQIDNVDQGIVRISSLLTPCEITFEKPKRIWDEWNIPWIQVFTSKYHLIFVLLTIVVVLIFARRASSKKLINVKGYVRKGNDV